MRRVFFAWVFFSLLAMSLMTGNAAEIKDEELLTELHWGICEKSPQVVLKKLGLKVKDKEQRGVSYYDLWSQELQGFEYFSQGIVLRIRSYSNGGSRSTVKIKFEEFPEFPEFSDEWTTLKGFKCEEDLNTSYGSRFCSLSEDSSEFSKTQKMFLRTFGLDVNWNLIKEHGPSPNSVWDLKSSELGRLALEQFLLKSGEKILELSTRVETSHAVEGLEYGTQWLKSRKIHLCETQESKTKRVLDSYKKLQNQ
ncbi:MAG: hypothetical protein R3A80_09180 [Bdellovibrionota bacterium]